MMEFVIIAIVLTSTYIILYSLMKAAGKSAPSVPTISHISTPLAFQVFNHVSSHCI